MENNISNIYSKENLEFVTVATEFCSFLENYNKQDSTYFIDKTLKILPLLYLKMSLILPGIKEIEDFFLLEEHVTEADYNYIRNKISQLLKEKDDYLDVFVEDMKYSEAPILKHISEDLADIYQDIRNFVEIFSQRNEEATEEALSEVRSLFETHWGQILVNTMRALHEAKFNYTTENTFDY